MPILSNIEQQNTKKKKGGGVRLSSPNVKARIRQTTEQTYKPK